MKCYECQAVYLDTHRNASGHFRCNRCRAKATRSGKPLLIETDEDAPVTDYQLTVAEDADDEERRQEMLTGIVVFIALAAIIVIAAVVIR